MFGDLASRSAGLFLNFYVVGHGDDIGANVERGLDAETNLRGGTIILEAADKFLQRADTFLAEHAVEVGVDTKRHSGGFFLLDGVVLATVALRELGVVDVENPIHGCKGGCTLGGVCDVDIDIHCHWDSFGQ